MNQNKTSDNKRKLSLNHKRDKWRGDSALKNDVESDLEDLTEIKPTMDNK